MCTPDPQRLCISAGASQQPRKRGLYEFPLDLVTGGWAWGSVSPSLLSYSATLSNKLNHFSMLQTGCAEQTGHMFSKIGVFSSFYTSDAELGIEAEGEFERSQAESTEWKKVMERDEWCMSTGAARH